MHRAEEAMQRTASLQRRSLDFGSASYGYSRDGGTPTFQGFKAGPGAAGGGGGGTPRQQEYDSDSDDDDVNEVSCPHLDSVQRFGEMKLKGHACLPQHQECDSNSDDDDVNEAVCCMCHCFTRFARD